MELITILSTIILIATISTFILSIGAYILYKIRSRREQRPQFQAIGSTRAELVTVPEVEDFEEVHRQAGRTNLSRVHGDNTERGVDKVDGRVDRTRGQSGGERIIAPKYTKYPKENPSSSKKDYLSGDLQWK